jgi:hypothetical protein
MLIDQLGGNILEVEQDLSVVVWFRNKTTLISCSVVLKRVMTRT